MIIISDYTNSNLPSISNPEKDYQNVINTFKNIKTSQYDVVFAETNQIDSSTFSLKRISCVDSPNDNISKDKARLYNFKKKWSEEEISDFNTKLKQEFIENNNKNYDSLIYVISGHGDGKKMVYNSNGEEFMLTFIYYEFNNQQCRKLRNKPKIYLVDSQRAANTKMDKKSSNNGNRNEEPDPTPNETDKTSNTKLEVLDDFKDKIKNCKDEDETYVKHSHKRTICCPSGQQAMKWNSKCLENGSIFIQCFFHVLSKKLGKKSISLTDILFETRKYMVKMLRIPGINSIDAIVLQDDSTMPCKIEFDMMKNETQFKHEAKLSQNDNDTYTLKKNPKNVCVVVLFNYSCG